MNINETWGNIEWTTHARKLLFGIKKFPEDSKIIILIRHSERNELKSVWDTNELLLTPDGHRIAKKLGENLPIDRFIYIFTSHATRCQETAEDILKGFLSKGGNGKIIGNLEPLYKIGVERDFFLKQIENGDLIEYLQNWINGSFPKEKAQSIMSYSINAAKIIWASLNNASKGSIYLHVTHEIPIMAFRYGWFNLLPNDKWVNFLGAIAFTLHNGKILLFDIDRFLTLEFPKWWNTKNFE
ncbi:MAG: histidine phosphatase family protein [Candidatus Thorarchaeota archaeon]